MAKRVGFVTVLLSIFVSLLSVPSTPRASAADHALVVVIAKNSGLDDISMADLRRLYLGLPTVVDGHRLLPLNLPLGTPGRTKFDRKVLGLEPERVGAFWVDRRIRDQSSPPRAVPSAALAAKVVASLPGAVTYLPAYELNPRINALRIDGRVPGEPGYPLQ